MSIAVDVSREGVRIALSEQRVREVVRAVCRREHVRDALVSVTFVTNARMARLNREFLGHKGATDVITFQLHANGPGARRDAAVIGDIYIAPQVAGANARERGIGIREELARLVIHGTLHVLGYIHDEGDQRMTGEMWRRQEALIAAIV